MAFIQIKENFYYVAQYTIFFKTLALNLHIVPLNTLIVVLN